MGREADRGGSVSNIDDRVGNTGKRAHQVGSAVSGDAGDANERKDSGNDVAKVDEEVGGGRRRTLAEEVAAEEEGEQPAREAREGGASRRAAISR